MQMCFSCSKTASQCVRNQTRSAKSGEVHNAPPVAAATGGDRHAHFKTRLLVDERVQHVKPRSWLRKWTRFPRGAAAAAAAAGAAAPFEGRNG